jgi:hypothetical protein
MVEALRRAVVAGARLLLWEWPGSSTPEELATTADYESNRCRSPIPQGHSKSAYQATKSGLLRVATVHRGQGVNYRGLSRLGIEFGIFRRSSPLSPHRGLANVSCPRLAGPFVLVYSGLAGGDNVF